MYNIMWCSLSVTCDRFSLGTPVSSINKTDSHEITELLLKVALNSTNLNQPRICFARLDKYIVIYIKDWSRIYNIHVIQMIQNDIRLKVLALF